MVSIQHHRWQSGASTGKNQPSLSLSLVLLVQDETGRKINRSDFPMEKGYTPWWSGLLYLMPYLARGKWTSKVILLQKKN